MESEPREGPRPGLAKILLIGAVVGAGYAALQGARLLPGNGQGWTADELSLGLALEGALMAGAVSALVAAPLWLGRRRLAAGLAVGLVALALALSPHRPPAARPAASGEAGGASTIVLITGDTLRRDHVSAWPGARVSALTPRLERLAQAGERFDQAVATAPLTLPSHTAMLTGVTPQQSGVIVNGRTVPPTLASAPALLAAAGYRAGAFTSSSILHGSQGLTGWFEVYRDELGPVPGHSALPLTRLLFRAPGAKRDLIRKERGDRTVARALRWLAGLGPDEAVFLWVHLYDPHMPHSDAAQAPGVGTARDLLPDPCDYTDHPSARRASVPRLLARVAAAQRDRERCEGRDWEPVLAQVDSYASEVALLDRAVGQLLDGLEAAGRGDAAILFAADHGESLTEHNLTIAHQGSLYDPVVHVPLIVVAPGVTAAGARRAEVVSTAQVAATLLDFGHVAPPPEMAPSLLHPQPAQGPATSVSQIPRQLELASRSSQASCRDAQRKVLVDTEGRIERYDLVEDPNERRPLATEAEIGAMAAPVAASPHPGLTPFSADRLTARRADGRPLAERLGYEARPAEDLTAFEALEACSRAALREVDAVNQADRGADTSLPAELREDLRALGYTD